MALARGDEQRRSVTSAISGTSRILRQALFTFHHTVTMTSGPTPSMPRSPSRAAPTASLALLALSMLAIGLAPLGLDESYSWLEHTTSEAAGQGVRGAWMSRAGFLFFGLAVLWLAHRKIGQWRQPSTAMHVAFGACLAAVAAFSLRAWDDAAPYDRTEDLLHSIAATMMGFAFAIGVVSVNWTWGRRARLRPLDALAIAASLVLSLAMAAIANYAGALQRAMFAIAYVWYAREAVDS